MANQLRRVSQFCPRKDGESGIYSDCQIARVERLEADLDKAKAAFVTTKKRSAKAV